MKTDVFERLAKKYHDLKTEGRFLRNNGYDETAQETRHRQFGILDAVAALGFHEDEFIEYYRSNRSRFRTELNQG